MSTSLIPVQRLLPVRVVPQLTAADFELPVPVKQAYALFGLPPMTSKLYAARVRPFPLVLPADGNHADAQGTGAGLHLHAYAVASVPVPAGPPVPAGGNGAAPLAAGATAPLPLRSSPASASERRPAARTTPQHERSPASRAMASARHKEPHDRPADPDIR